MRKANSPLPVTRVGHILNKARKSQGMTLEDLTIELGYSKVNSNMSTVSQILTGKKELPFDRIAVVSYRLNIPIDELLVAISEDFQMRLVLSVGEKWPYLKKNLFLN